MYNHYFAGLTGKVVTPRNPAYKMARQEWNRAIQKFPLAIVYCFHKNDVSNAICWARRNRADIRIRSGGHNYEGYSTGNSVLVIDVSRMNGLSFDSSRHLIKVQGGIKNRQLYAFLGSQGYPFAGGTCPTVGLSGYALGGGWGYSCRYFGLGCDNLVELELVDYTGRIITANQCRNADLFWACRGAGGGNFGVIVSMTFRVPARVDKVTLFELYYPHASKQAQVDFLATWQDWLRTLDIRMGLQSSTYNSAEEGLATYARGLFYGSAEEANDILQPFANITGVILTLKYLTFLEAITEIEDSYPDSEKFKTTGRFVNRQYNRRELEHLVDIIREERPPGSIITSIGSYALGGTVKDIGPHDTAFFYRDADYILNIGSVWEKEKYADQNIDWVRKHFRYIKSITEGSYINFPYSGLLRYEAAYFGQNVSRLEKIKRKYDPFNVFSFPQSIRS